MNRMIGFGEAFTSAKNVDYLHFARRIDAMHADRAFFHHVEAFKGRTLPEQTLAFPETFLHDKGRDALQVLDRKFRKQVASLKGRCECRTPDSR